ncbi:MAG: lipopolysaccharide heptosyltransferase II, partial [Gemmatimonadales bacterium]|nr:lipopolysaccharide heptosyltransferase II [Gemmatimonadales bacterium]
MHTPPRRILVVGPAWVGDMVMAQSLFMTLQTRVPGVVIDVLAPRWSLPILTRTPEVRRSVEMAAGPGQLGLIARRRLGRALREERYDQAIVLPLTIKSALTPFFARIPQRTGYRGEVRYGLLNDIRTLNPDTLPGTVQRYVALGLPADAPTPPPTPYPKLTVRPDNQRHLIQRLGLDLARPVILFTPGAEFGPSRRWPIEHFTALARRLTAAGYQVWLDGSPKEVELGERIRQAAECGVINLCGRTSLEDAIDLAALATTVVSNDSGLMHVASAVGTRVIGLFGPSSPSQTPPLNAHRHIFYLDLPCSPCH